MVSASLTATEGKFVTGVLFGGITAAVVGIVPALISVVVLVTVDFLTGILAAVKNKVKIESHKMRKTAYKLLAYLSVILLAALIDGGVGFEFNLGSFVAGFVAVTEFVSVIENAGRITGHDAFERLRQILGKKTDKAMEH